MKKIKKYTEIFFYEYYYMNTTIKHLLYYIINVFEEKIEKK